MMTDISTVVYQQARGVKREIVYFLIILMQGNGLFYGSGMLHLMLSLWCLPALSLEQNTRCSMSFIPGEGKVQSCLPGLRLRPASCFVIPTRVADVCDAVLVCLLDTWF